MSLDVYLTEITPIKKKGTGVFIRKNGQTVELTIEEVKEKFPDAEVEENEFETSEVFNYNITHNLTEMANAFDLDFEKLKTEYFGDQFAKKMYAFNCSTETLIVAEEKVNYLKSINAKQAKLEL